MHNHKVVILILTNCHAIMKIFLRKLTFTKYQAFLQNFYATKIWNYTLCTFSFDMCAGHQPVKTSGLLLGI